ncbi:lysine 5,6-aminomutase reactivase ATPase KamC [Vallitalea maricola]|uniref:lysine 5,6-aminomutase reactivase ATPase KamC n=1 Tax=Vallitalea maricola TaxID=3074433 RepID=UPI0030D8B4F2
MKNIREVVIIKYLDNKIKEEIGFNYILNELSINTPYGMAVKKKNRVYRKEEYNLLRNELDNVEKIIDSLHRNKEAYSEIERTMMEFKDITNLIKRYNRNYILDEVELFEIKSFAINTQKLLSTYKNLDLDIDIKFQSMKSIIKLLNPENKTSHTFSIYNAYSIELEEVRNKKIKLEKLIFKEENQERIKLLKSERLDLVVEEEKLESSIKKCLSEKIYDYIDDIKHNIDAIGRLDMLIAKGRIAIKYLAVKPKILEEVNICFKDMKNPKVINYLRENNKDYIPVSISLEKGVTVITGANMGGKSVTIKTMVLNLLLALMGFYVFAAEAEVAMMDFVYLISDDMQSISKGLSSFGAEIIKINEAIKDIKTGNGFIGLDEFARVTNPGEGVILLRALCKFLKDYNTVSLISTHYDGIIDRDMKHYQVVGLKNVDEINLRNKINVDREDSTRIIQDKMDYRLEIVDEHCAVPKDAIKVAKLLGLDEKILDYTEAMIKNS